MITRTKERNPTWNEVGDVISGEIVLSRVSGTLLDYFITDLADLLGYARKSRLVVQADTDLAILGGYSAVEGEAFTGSIPVNDITELSSRIGNTDSVMNSWIANTTPLVERLNDRLRLARALSDKRHALSLRKGRDK